MNKCSKIIKENKDYIIEFLGYGCAFNPHLGNTSCYIYSLDTNSMMLFDCGSLVFNELMKRPVIMEREIKKFDIFISHTHTDHIGSLGTLIEYLHYNKDIVPRIFVGDKEKKFKLKNILSNSNILECMYEIYDMDVELIVNDNNRFVVESCELLHSPKVENIITSTAYIVRNTMSNETFVFAWDTCNVSNKILDLLKTSSPTSYVYVFHDCCYTDFPENPHCTINNLINQIPPKYHKNIYLVHIGSTILIEGVAKDYEFNVF